MAYTNEMLSEFLKNKLDMEDEFEFSCDECGKCCHERDDLILSPYDIFRIAGYLKISCKEVITKYCEMYEGENTKLPVVRTKQKIHGNVCPFLKGTKCSIQPVKPNICGIYPLGRAFDEHGNTIYFKPPILCGGTKNRIRVKDWIEKFGLDKSEEAVTIWGAAIRKFAKHITRNKINREHKEAFLNSMASIFYANYETTQDFITQLNEHIKFAQSVIEFTTSKKMYDGK